MALFNAGILVREQRKAQGITQAELAEGICSRESIVKIESGQRRPSYFVFKELMRRLGIPEQNYTDIASEDEIYLLDKTREIYNLTLNFKHEEVHKEIMEIERGDTGPFSTENGHQQLLGIKAQFYSQGPYKDNELSLTCAMELLKINRPGFDLDKLESYYLSVKEITVVNLIVINTKETKGPVEALELLIRLKNSIDKKYMNIEAQVPYYNEFLANIVYLAYESGEYQACIDYADEFMVLSRSYSNTRVFATQLLYKAKSLVSLGKKDEAKDIYTKVVMFEYIYSEQHALNSYKMVADEFRALYGNKIEFAV